ncbi:Peptidyl-tRNA hydrolase 2, mitochondrial [Zootermopsis nevadensis]|uniref:peptidyl-tRNA hydrolase n=1 Tax=Zootermopsis nevadensis TaxID=136037 RepID=A0A067QXH1_ZOONE|nr:Peptidyl-tRNA hydrolase 2, mitochondrial [Zootermopsis nevadensis]
MSSERHLDYQTLVTGLVIGFSSAWILKRNIINTMSLVKSVAHVTQCNMKLVFVVRTDLGIGKGKLASQCSHAAVRCYQNMLNTSPKTLRLWELNGQPKIVLKAEEDGEQYLLQLHDKAKALGLVTAIIRDSGKTQVESGTITVLGIGPGESFIVDQITKHLKLL